MGHSLSSDFACLQMWSQAPVPTLLLLKQSFTACGEAFAAVWESEIRVRCQNFFFSFIVLFGDQHSTLKGLFVFTFQSSQRHCNGVENFYESMARCLLKLAWLLNDSRKYSYSQLPLQLDTQYHSGIFFYCWEGVMHNARLGTSIVVFSRW